MKIKNILISQPEPTEKSPYADLSEKYGVDVIFRKFIQVEGIELSDFRKQGIDILAHSAIVFNSKTGIDYYFRMCKKMKIETFDTQKYFCISTIVANYLHKYITCRKRKIFFPENNNNTPAELARLIAEKNNSNEKFLLVLSEEHQSDLANLLQKAKCAYNKGFFYKTVNSDLSDVNIDDYQLLAFFSPLGIVSLNANFPKFEQGNTIIAAMGTTTGKAVTDASLRLDIPVPTAEAKSMPSAIDLFLSKKSRSGK